MNELAIHLDLSGIERADDGDTMHFGGTYTVDGEVFRGYGDDRSDNWEWDLIEMIVQAAAEFGVEIDHDVVLDAVESIEVATLLISKDGDLSIEE